MLSLQDIDCRDLPDFDQHERVIACRDPDTGLDALIALHDTTRGPALGGVRMHAYSDRGAAVTDVLRLAQGMSYKAALADLPLGGGKAVIIGAPAAPPAGAKSSTLLHAFGRAVHALNGAYLAGQDSGITVNDLVEIGTSTPHTVGTAARQAADGRSVSGDPSPSTARGVLVAIQSALDHRQGSSSLAGVRVAIQGLGAVGAKLAEALLDAGAVLTVADVRAAHLAPFQERTNVTIVDGATIHRSDVDVFAPCALGGVLNAKTIRQIKARVVAGAANNQLATAADADRLLQRGILYAPDYVANAGGLIQLYHVRAGKDGTAINASVDGIAATLRRIFIESDAESVSTARVADAHARTLLKQQHRSHSRVA
ncbi:MAG: Glu/Leu/Phe/Val dehydrogenase dimerization domain-containing protein [Pseudomonadota bacterium]